ncbi:hypothetical protein JCM17960_23680 [Magnetospira thiophila]
MNTIIELKPEWTALLDGVMVAYENGDDFEGVRLAKLLCDDLARYPGEEADVARERLHMITEALNLAA